MDVPKHLKKYISKGTKEKNNFEIYKKAMNTDPHKDSGVKIIDDSDDFLITNQEEGKKCYNIDKGPARVKRLNEQVIWKELDDEEQPRPISHPENDDNKLLNKKRER
jgi:hypothetical protein